MDELLDAICCCLFCFCDDHDYPIYKPSENLNDNNTDYKTDNKTKYYQY